VLGLVWLLASFGPLLFARELGFEFFGAPFVIWLCSQGAPIIFVLLVWRYERGMSRLDQDLRAGRVD
jgi:putative solute:sodium symporter small subunit